MVLISVPGEYAAAEARRALLLDKHVMLFSSNVSIEDEVALKKEAVSRGLLCMGPDCGTAIINGKPLAFANVVRRGVIGVVGAAGTGIQEVTSLIHRLGGGISQAIGVGGRDLTDAVGGAMTLLGIEALAGDPGTQVIVVISKPPSPLVSRKIVEALAASSKPCVVHFVGARLGADAEAPIAGSQRTPAANRSVFFAGSLAGAAEAAFRLAATPGDRSDGREVRRAQRQFARHSIRRHTTRRRHAALRPLLRRHSGPRSSCDPDARRARSAIELAQDRSAPDHGRRARPRVTSSSIWVTRSSRRDGRTR